MPQAELPLLDLPLDHPAADLMREKLGVADLVKIERRPAGPFGSCYWISSDLAAQLGGQLALGWLITYVPGLYVQATHHGVVGFPDGTLLDVTAPEWKGAPPAGTSTFAPAPNTTIDLTFPDIQLNKFVALTQDPDVHGYIQAYEENASLYKQAYRTIREDGRYTWSPRSGLAGPPFSSKIDEAFERVTPSYDCLQTHLMRLRQRYFPNLK